MKSSDKTLTKLRLVRLKNYSGWIVNYSSSKSLINKIPELHQIGCLGKITTFQETDDGRYLIELKGIIRFRKL